MVHRLLAESLLLHLNSVQFLHLFWYTLVPYTALGRAYGIRFLLFLKQLANFHETWLYNRSPPHEGLQLHAGSVKYIWPLQTAVSDGGAQRRRLDAIRKELGWRVIGCYYIECFS